MSYGWGAVRRATPRTATPVCPPSAWSGHAGIPWRARNLAPAAMSYNPAPDRAGGATPLREATLDYSMCRRIARKLLLGGPSLPNKTPYRNVSTVGSRRMRPGRRYFHACRVEDRKLVDTW